MFMGTFKSSFTLWTGKLLAIANGFTYDFPSSMSPWHQSHRRKAAPLGAAETLGTIGRARWSSCRGGVNNLFKSMTDLMKNADAATLPAPPARGCILFADDDEQVRLSLGKQLTRAGFGCDFAGTGDEAVALLAQKQYDVLLSDINMPGNFGLELVKKMPAVIEGLPVILLTGSPTVETAARSVRLRVLAYLTKPPDFAELCELLDSAVAERRSARVLNDSRQRLQGWDREIERLQRLLQQSSATDRKEAMQSYLRLTLRQLLVGLVEMEHLLIHDGERLGTDQAVEKQELLNAVRKTVGILQKTKDHFKSKELGALRKELETLIG